jgi:hypothetical protein
MNVACVLAVTLIGCAAAPPTQASPAPPDVLSYRHGLPPILQDEIPNLGSASLKPAEQKPELKAEPALAGKPTYFAISLGGPANTPYVAIFDPGANGGKGALYFDADHDGDLAKEKPLSAERWEQADNFGPIAIKLKRDGFAGLYHFCIQRRQYTVQILTRGMADQTRDIWYLRPACYNVGEITIGGKRYRCATVDGSANGVFNDVWRKWEDDGDLWYVDWNGNGKFDSDEGAYCTRRYRRDDRWYTITTNADGTAVAFAPGEFKFGTLTAGEKDFAVQLISRTGEGLFTAGGQDGRIQVPADDYEIYRCWCNRRDAAGARWVADGSRSPSVQISVREGEETRLTMGQPFAASLVAQTKGPYRAGQQITFEAKLTGADGKDYQFLRDKERQPAPRMVIRDESGRQLGTCAFQYG